MTYFPTSTVNYCTPAATPDISCGNKGLQYAAWDDPSHVFLYTPSALSSSPATGSGVAYPALGAATVYGTCNDPSQPITFANVYLPSCAWWTLVHRGFVYAGQSGSYTFTITPPIDDEVYVWLGDVAFTGYANANTAVQLSGASPNPVSYTYQATAGEYIPIRIQFSQGPGVYTYHFSIQKPDGTFILNDSTQTDDIVQFGCNGATKNWLPWGNETG